MICYKAYRVRIYPNQSQLKWIWMIFNGQRKVYNTILQHHRESYLRYNGSYSESLHLESVIKQHPWLKRIPKDILHEEKKKVDEKFRSFGLKRHSFYKYETFPHYHACDAYVPMSYVDKTKCSLAFGVNPKNHHRTIRLSHLGFVDVCKTFENRFAKFLEKHQLVYGINFHYISTKITKSVDGKYYATLLFHYDNGIIEYKPHETNWYHHMTCNAIGIDDCFHLTDDQLLMDSDGRIVQLGSRYNRLSKYIKALQTKKDFHTYKIQRLFYRKIEQLRNYMLSFVHLIVYRYRTYDVIVLSSHVYPKRFDRYDLQTIFRKYTFELMNQGIFVTTVSDLKILKRTNVAQALLDKWRYVN